MNCLSNSKSISDDRDHDELELRPLDIEDVYSPHVLLLDGDSSKDIFGSPPVSNKYFSVVMGMKRRRDGQVNRKKMVRRHWQEAAMKARSLGDPWEKFHLDSYPAEHAVRHRYHTLRQMWVTDDVLVKMDPKPFGHGAMRECFRLKKHSNFSHCHSWKASANYVAKRYMEPVDRQVYFEDVKLQMDAKLWGEEYNRHNPPKKVDIIQVSILEFVDRKSRPLFHLEHYIEGDYIKYNSNSGFVADDKMRLTPQSFSHFTFERSGHELLVVDIQGVGDLYTDPQIHTLSGKEYNEGNLGTRGMALFFHSHVCNAICESLGLSKFDLAPSEEQSLVHISCLEKCSATRIRGSGPELCISPSQNERKDWHDYFRSRSLSSGSFQSNATPPSPNGSDLQSRTTSCGSQSSLEDDMFSESDSGIVTRRRNRIRLDSGSVTEEGERIAFSALLDRKSRPSCVQHEVEYRRLFHVHQFTGGSALGQMHLDLAKYHELCRFSEPGEDIYDKDAAFFHLKHAADCGNLEAIVTLSQIYLQLPHDILVDLEVPVNAISTNKGMEYTLIAAEAGDRASMIRMAKAYDTGVNLGTDRVKSWKDAFYWYEEAVHMDGNDESDQYDGCMHDPNYLLLERQAELCLEGGYGLERDVRKAGELYQEAASAATAAMKGRLASKYFCLAEEAWGQAEE